MKEMVHIETHVQFFLDDIKAIDFINTEMEGLPIVTNHRPLGKSV